MKLLLLTLLGGLAIVAVPAVMAVRLLNPPSSIPHDLHGTVRAAKLAQKQRQDAQLVKIRAANAKLAEREAAQATIEKEKKMDEAKLAEMKQKLTPEQYNVCFLKGTEPPFSGKYYKNHEPGEYHCAACGQLLFKSDTKFDSGTGWPSFWDMSEPGAVTKHEDHSLGMMRTEVLCSKCGAHLGHVFDDGPQPTGQRYCINSLALEFVPAAEAGKQKAEAGKTP